jgi:peptidoglycan/LPS O-acetylase OafA/YrhL
MVLATFYGVDTNVERVPQIYGTTLLAVGTCLLLLGLLNQEITDIWLLRPLTWPGRYSYGLYLFHATTLYFLHPYIRPLPTWEAFSIYAVTTTLVAAFSYKYFEMPCNHWIRGRFGEK